MTKQEYEDEAIWMRHMVDVWVDAKWRRWGQTSLEDFLVGLAVLCTIVMLLSLLQGC